LGAAAAAGAGERRGEAADLAGAGPEEPFSRLTIASACAIGRDLASCSRPFFGKNTAAKAESCESFAQRPDSSSKI